MLKISKIYLSRCNLSFKSKNELNLYTRQWAKSIYDKKIDDPTDSNYKFLLDMIDRHPYIQVESKMKFVIHTPNGYCLSPDRKQKRTPFRRSEPHRSYVYIPSQKKWVSFSLFTKCITARDDTENLKRNKEFRKIIEPQIIRERRMRIWECEICKSIKNIDVDHYPLTFSSIVQKFISENQRDSFYDFHLKLASYRLLCKSCHIQNTVI